MLSPKMHTERTFTLLLRKYGLEQDFRHLWMASIRSAQAIGQMEQVDLIAWRLKGTWAQYCDMYKQETGKDHKYA